MEDMIRNDFIDAFHIEIGPARWSRASINVTSGVNIINSLLSTKYFAYIIARRSDSCPENVITRARVDGIQLSRGAILFYITWAELPLIINRTRQTAIFISPKLTSLVK